MADYHNWLEKAGVRLIGSGRSKRGTLDTAVAGYKKSDAIRREKRTGLTIRGLAKWAIATQLRTDDPTEGIELERGFKSQGHMTWREPQVE
ncbi:MAG TPA: hypothetical protein VFI98_08330 [Pseudolabrys sp.]|nr:hypothetical protein [Pseudolabrys sp.]